MEYAQSVYHMRYSLFHHIEYFRYPCTWGGVVDGKPLTGNLEQFGMRALNNLWNAVQKDFPDQVMTRKFWLIIEVESNMTSDWLSHMVHPVRNCLTCGAI